MAATTAILAMSAANTINQFVGQRRAADIAEQQGNFEGGLFDMNAALADNQAADILARGHQAESQVRRQGQLLAGSQRAAYAAQGLDTSVGSPRAVIENDARLTEVDALTIRNNARREAWGYGVQAAGYRAQGQYARSSGRNQAKYLRTQSFGTLLNGAGELANIWSSAPKGVGKGDYGKSIYGRGGMFGYTDY